MKFALAGIALLFLAASAFAQTDAFTIQVKADRSQAAAAGLVEQLRASGLDAYYQPASVRGKGVFFRVRVGRFASAEQARQAARDLHRASLIADSFIARYREEPGQVEAGRPLMAEEITPAFPTAPSESLVPEAPAVEPSLEENEPPGMVPAAYFEHARASSPRRDERWPAAAPWRLNPPSVGAPQIIGAGRRGSWEIFLAGGGSLWSDKEVSLTARDFIGRDLGPPGAVQPAIRLREAFATGARLMLGVVKNTSARSAFELSYAYGTNNFKLTALQDGAQIGIADIQRGATLALGMRSHLVGYYYRRTLWEGEVSRLYFTVGGSLAIFTPHGEGSGLRLLLANPTAFKSGPTFETVLTPAVEYGAGWVVKLNRKVALRFDLRDYLTSAKRVRATAELTTGEKAELKLFGGAVQNVVPTLGIVFIF